MGKIKLAVTAGAVVALLLSGVAGGCGGGSPVALDTHPTKIQFLEPAASAYLHGQVHVKAVASGPNPIESFKFLAPAALTNAPAGYDTANRSATLETMLDLSQFPDGELKISASATDKTGRETNQDLTINVANHAPDISVSKLDDTVKGTVAISATATAQNGATLVRFELLNPPAGVGPDAFPATDTYGATWDTTKAPEGLVALHFQAEDSTGLISDKIIHVIVDNIPLGTFDVRVSAGAPIANAMVTIYAIDDATGQVSATAGANGVLGTGGPTDAAGQALVTLSSENWSGPVQIVASGSSLAYVNPAASTPVTIQVPTSFVFSSYLPSHTAGSGVTVPVSLLTTLADHEALAYAKGRHPQHAGEKLLSAALTERDPLWVNHVTTTVSAWAPTSLRTTVPVIFGADSALIEGTYAELFDVALNQLARNVASQAGFGTDSTAINAITLAQLLEKDLDADAQFDGKGDAGQPLVTLGLTPVTLDAQLLRVPLATALDEWIRSPNNKSAITRIDLNNAGVYTTMSGDASDLFGAPPSGSFDNEPPTITVSATYAISEGSNAAVPFGPSRYVGGTVTLVVDASDPAGVQSIAAAVGASSLTRDAVQSTASHYVGTWPTKAISDGPLTFTITASDTHGNVGSTTYNVVVDNSPPAITIVKPTSGHYSTSVEIEATASDGASGVVSLTQSGLTGFIDQDGQAERLAGTWSTSSLPASPANLTASSTLEACDAVGNCSTLPLDISIDRTPPTVDWAPALPQYFNAPRLTVSVTATDAPSGVKAVWVQVGGGSKVAAVRDPTSGLWAAEVTLINGRNQISVWAEDSAQPAANSGAGLAAPYLRSADVVLDTEAPVPINDGTFMSYYDERNMTVVKDATGLAKVPAVYSSANGKVPISPNLEIYKAATRLSAGSTLNASDLEGPNPANIPVLRFTVAYEASSHAPIASATYSITCRSCSGSSATSTGKLIPSTKTVAGSLLYDLPLSTETVPGLASITGSTVLDIRAILTDQAGNVTPATAPFNVTFHVIGPPIAWFEDTNYASSGDPKGTHPYQMSNGTYGTLFDGATSAFMPEQKVRLLRYVLSNPSPSPVAVSIPLASPSWQATETWLGDGQALTGGFNQDGFSYPGSVDWAKGGACDTVPEGPSCIKTDTSPYHEPGQTTQYSCASSGSSLTTRPSPQANLQQGSGALSTLAYLSGGSAIKDVTQATKVGANYVIPAATATAPGTLVVYLTRPKDSGARPTPLRWGKVNPYASTPSRYEVIVDDAWTSSASWESCTKTLSRVAAGDSSSCTYCCGLLKISCNWDSFNNQCRQIGGGVIRECYPTETYSHRYYTATRWIRVLGSAWDTLSGSLGFVTQGLGTSGSAVFGEPTTVKTGLAFTQSISHGSLVP